MIFPKPGQWMKGKLISPFQAELILRNIAFIQSSKLLNHESQHSFKRLCNKGRYLSLKREMVAKNLGQIVLSRTDNRFAKLPRQTDQHREHSVDELIA